MKKSILAILTVLMLASCDPAPKKGADDYAFESKEYEKTSLNIEFVILKNQSEFNQAARMYAPGVEGLEAFGIIQPDTNNCKIFIKDPEWQYVPEFIGHEIAHCIWGRWHSKRDSKEASQGLRPKEL
jgi:hypothetical protein